MLDQEFKIIFFLLYGSSGFGYGMVGKPKPEEAASEDPAPLAISWKWFLMKSYEKHNLPTRKNS
jgi:hypothetical protein